MYFAIFFIHKLSSRIEKSICNKTALTKDPMNKIFFVQSLKSLHYADFGVDFKIKIASPQQQCWIQIKLVK